MKNLTTCPNCGGRIEMLDATEGRTFYECENKWYEDGPCFSEFISVVVEQPKYAKGAGCLVPPEQH